MAQHKAATSVTIAPIDEKSGLALFVDRYWRPAALAVLVIVAVVVYRQVTQGRQEEAVTEAWAKISEATQGTLSAEQADRLATVAGEVEGTEAAPWALYMAAVTAAQAHEYEQARTFLERLRKEHPGSPVLTQRFERIPGEGVKSSAELLEERVQAQLAWRAQHPDLFRLPDLPEGAPRVRVNTDRGSFVVGLYTDKAPKHAERFLQLARDGSFTGMKFHRVVANRVIQSGDPNTLQEDVSTWGAGELGAPQAGESNALGRLEGALASGHTRGSMTSSGSQFQVLLADDAMPDPTSVVFGKVIEGLDVAKTIGEAKTVEGTDRPEDPATIQSTEVL